MIEIPVKENIVFGGFLLHKLKMSVGRKFVL